jgi:hypothetical protein
MAAFNGLLQPGGQRRHAAARWVEPAERPGRQRHRRLGAVQYQAVVAGQVAQGLVGGDHRHAMVHGGHAGRWR